MKAHDFIFSTTGIIILRTGAMVRIGEIVKPTPAARTAPISSRCRPMSPSQARLSWTSSPRAIQEREFVVRRMI